MKIVLWRIAHDCLPTGQQLSIRHIPASDACCYCGRVESVQHVFLTCHYVAEIWWEMKKWWGITRKIKSFISIRQWLFDYLASASHEDATIFTVVVWHIWEARNEVRNGETLKHPRCVAEKGKAYIDMTCTSCNATNISNRCEPDGSIHKWVPPPKNWIMTNTNAAIFGDTGKMGAGCVIRDRMGNFLAATCQSIGRVTDLELAESIAPAMQCNL